MLRVPRTHTPTHEDPRRVSRVRIPARLRTESADHPPFSPPTVSHLSNGSACPCPRYPRRELRPIFQPRSISSSLPAEILSRVSLLGAVQLGDKLGRGTKCEPEKGTATTIRKLETVLPRYERSNTLHPWDNVNDGKRSIPGGHFLTQTLTPTLEGGRRNTSTRTVEPDARRAGETNIRCMQLMHAEKHTM